MDKDARLNELIRLKRAPPAPIERWQMVPTRRCAGPGMGERKSKPSSLNQQSSSPLRQIPSNIQMSKTPECGRLLMKTPSARVRSKTPGACASSSRTPGKQHKSTTPGRNGPTPSSSCRFIPNRYIYCSSAKEKALAKVTSVLWPIVFHISYQATYLEAFSTFCKMCWMILMLL